MMYCKDKTGEDRLRCKKCKMSISIKTLTPFGYSRISLNLIFMNLLLLWMELDIIQSSIITGVSENTISKFWKFARECCEMELARSFEKIGGESVEVEIDEAVFKRRKYNKGRKKKHIWVFGMIERKNSNKFKLFIVKKRDKKTLIPLINNNIKPGSIMYSDEWRAYYNIKNNCFIHKTINHSKTFAKNEINTNHIENLWGRLRGFLPKHGVKEKHIEKYFSFFMFKKLFKDDFLHFVEVVLKYKESDIDEFYKNKHEKIEEESNEETVSTEEKEKYESNIITRKRRRTESPSDDSTPSDNLKEKEEITVL